MKQNRMLAAVCAIIIIIAVLATVVLLDWVVKLLFGVNGFWIMGGAYSILTVVSLTMLVQDKKNL